MHCPSKQGQTHHTQDDRRTEQDIAMPRIYDNCLDNLRRVWGDVSSSQEKMNSYKVIVTGGSIALGTSHSPDNFSHCNETVWHNGVRRPADSKSVAFSSHHHVELKDLG